MAEAETDDTASSKCTKDEIRECGFSNTHIMQEILSYRERKKGACPTKSDIDFKKFCQPYIRMGVGNEDLWHQKKEEMKNRFNNNSAPVEGFNKKEFELWKKIWGECMKE